MKFDLVIPAYNEEAVIGDTIRTLARELSVFRRDISWRLIVADNGSTDSTKAKALATGVPQVSVLSVSGKGKGRALREATQASEAEIFGFIDADLSAEPSSILPLYEAVASGRADIAIGSRLLDKASVRRGFIRTLTSELFNLLRRAILGIEVRDSQCGLKLMNEKGKKIISESEESTWFLDLELLAVAQRRGLRVLEIPVAWEEFRYKGRESKLRVVRDGIAAVGAMLRIRGRLSDR